MKQNFSGYRDVLKYAEQMQISAQTDFVMMAKVNHDQSNLIHRLNLDQTEELLHDIIFSDFPSVQEYFSPDHKRDLIEPEEYAERRICGAGIDKLCLGADGTYYACSGFSGYPLGNCYKQDLKTVWTQSPNILYLRSLRGKDIPSCIHCKNRDYCNLCLARNYNETGNVLHVPEHLCKVADLNRRLVEKLHASNQQSI